MKNQCNKNISLYILRILKENSCEQNPISQTEILNKLSFFNIKCDRKTISRCIDGLIEFGYNIQRKNGGGCYFINDNYDESEIIFLIDCIFSSQTISQKQALSLIDRLTKDFGYLNKNNYGNIYKNEKELIRTDNKEVFYNICQINNAIECKKQISFTYNKYNIEKKLTPRRKEKYIINPYFMANSKGKYFLICNKDNYDNISNYRIDYITNIELLDNDVKPLNKIEDYKQIINPVQYINEHVYMFSGKTIDVTLKCSDENVINDIIDWFGKDIDILKIQNEFQVKLKVNENAIIYWLLQYGDKVEILEPIDIRENIKLRLSKMIEIYK